ncbi:substrate-binding periplasmic protein [Maridesulfovibrio sp.]|uniref:substrate-binding periplasmic protein n=1 Tax=Maridesulfovibrio sp. TaxID=2795000 RepID=UPI0029F4DDA5|nr:transporter substrate-binding domain-containing protein [Maridesulfovibrio sp.]
MSINAAGKAYAGQPVYLASLEWPPYVGKNLPDEGSSAQIIRKAFAAMGYELKILFMPWKRTMRMVDTNHKIVGYFPEYYSQERVKRYIFSESYGCSPVSLLERKDKPISWESVDDLAALQVGFVAGYVNTPELDEAVGNGTINADFAPTDKSNIMKVMKGRIDCAVIDPLVYGYLASTDKDIGQYSDTVQIEPRAFGVNELYVAFRNDKQGLYYSRILNEGLRKVKYEKSCNN